MKLKRFSGLSLRNLRARAQRTLLTVREAHDRMADRLKFFTSNSPTDLQEIEEALLHIRERKERKAAGLEGADALGGGDAADSGKGGKGGKKPKPKKKKPSRADDDDDL